MLFECLSLKQIAIFQRLVQRKWEPGPTVFQLQTKTGRRKYCIAVIINFFSADISKVESKPLRRTIGVVIILNFLLHPSQLVDYFFKKYIARPLMQKKGTGQN
jgi:hypothetical protein